MNISCAKLVEYLQITFSPQAILLHGSRATGHNNESSDWDITLVVDQPNHQIHPMQWEQEDLDLSAFVLPIPEHIPKHFTTTLQNSVVLFEEQSIGQDVITACKKEYDQGPKLTAEDLQLRKDYMSRCLKRMERYQNDPLLFQLYLGDFYQQSIWNWFSTKNKWTIPAYSALPTIKKQDSTYHTLLQSLINSTPNDQVQISNGIQATLWKAS